MSGPLAQQLCRSCGEPAVDARVELDGSLTYFCARHGPETERPPSADPAAKPALPPDDSSHE